MAEILRGKLTFYNRIIARVALERKAADEINTIYFKMFAVMM
jgi:hypothetical protein